MALTASDCVWRAWGRSAHSVVSVSSCGRVHRLIVYPPDVSSISNNSAWRQSLKKGEEQILEAAEALDDTLQVTVAPNTPNVDCQTWTAKYGLQIQHCGPDQLGVRSNAPKHPNTQTPKHGLHNMDCNPTFVALATSECGQMAPHHSTPSAQSNIDSCGTVATVSRGKPRGKHR